MNIKTITLLGITALLLGLVGCTSFNRDALWNAPIQEDDYYCTYDKYSVTNNQIFVHMMDDWTEKRLDIGYELKIIRDLGNNTFEVDHGFTLQNIPKWDWNHHSYFFWSMEHKSIVIEILSNQPQPKVGEFLKVYGQYQLVGSVRLDDGKYHFLFKQINDKQVHVFEEKFIQF